MTGPSALSRRLVRTRTEAQMTSTVRVMRGALGQLDPVTGDVGGLESMTVIYEGKGRIRTVAGSGVLTVGEGTVDTRSTIISIPISSTPVPRRDDVVLVLNDDLADVDLDEHTFRVMDVDGGTLFGDARRLTCQGFAQSRYWGES